MFLFATVSNTPDDLGRVREVGGRGAWGAEGARVTRGASAGRQGGPPRTRPGVDRHARAPGAPRDRCEPGSAGRLAPAVHLPLSPPNRPPRGQITRTRPPRPTGQPRRGTFLLEVAGGDGEATLSPSLRVRVLPGSGFVNQRMEFHQEWLSLIAGHPKFCKRPSKAHIIASHENRIHVRLTRTCLTVSDGYISGNSKSSF